MLGDVGAVASRDQQRQHVGLARGEEERRRQLRDALRRQAGSRAVTARHTSLLPIGVIAVEGEFLRGDAVACVNSDGREVARGLANYSSDEARMIMRHPTRDIERLLGYVGEPELIHRDNLVNL